MELISGTINWVKNNNDDDDYDHNDDDNNNNKPTRLLGHGPVVGANTIVLLNGHSNKLLVKFLFYAHR